MKYIILVILLGLGKGTFAQVDTMTGQQLENPSVNMDMRFFLVKEDTMPNPRFALEGRMQCLTAPQHWVWKHWAWPWPKVNVYCYNGREYRARRRAQIKKGFVDWE